MTMKLITRFFLKLFAAKQTVVDLDVSEMAGDFGSIPNGVDYQYFFLLAVEEASGWPIVRDGWGPVSDGKVKAARLRRASEQEIKHRQNLLRPFGFRFSREEGRLFLHAELTNGKGGERLNFQGKFVVVKRRWRGNFCYVTVFAPVNFLDGTPPSIRKVNLQIPGSCISL